MDLVLDVACCALHFLLSIISYDYGHIFMMRMYDHRIRSVKVTSCTFDGSKNTSNLKEFFISIRGPVIEILSSYFIYKSLQTGSLFKCAII